MSTIEVVLGITMDQMSFSDKEENHTGSHKPLTTDEIDKILEYLEAEMKNTPDKSAQ